MMQALRFQLSQHASGFYRRYYYEVQFASLMAMCTVLWLAPKPIALYPFMPELILSGILAFAFSIPNRNICIEVFIIGLIQDGIMGTPFGLSALLLLVLYGVYARLIISIRNLGFFIHVLAVAILVIAERVLRFWFFILFGVPVQTLTIGPYSLLATFLTVFLLEAIIIYFNTSSLYASENRITR